MRRLVVGCGYLGGRVARLWREAGDEVYATTRGGNATVLARAGLRPLKWDVTTGPSPDGLPAVDTTVFAVGRARESGTTMFDIHVKGLALVLASMPVPGRVIYVSSTGVYGQNAGEWVDEESVCEPTREGGKACLLGEQLVLADVPRRDAVALRLAGLYGPGRVPHAASVAKGRPIDGSPGAYLNLIHVDDAAGAVVALAAATSLTRRTYAVSDGHPPMRREYIEALARCLGVEAPPFAGGGGLGKRVRNTRAVGDLGLRLRYPTFFDGLVPPTIPGSL